MSQPSISAFARLANGNVTPAREIKGQAALIARTIHQFALDEVHDEMVVPNPFSEAVLFFRGSANGEEKPLRIIHGPKTMLGYVANLAVDPVHNEVFAAQSQAIVVHAREGNGDVPPLRILRGPKARLGGLTRIAVDPINDLLVVPSRPGMAVLIFNRTDEGDVAPRAVIAGPKTGLDNEHRPTHVTLYPEGKLIFISVEGEYNREGRQSGHIAIWKYEDSGNIAPWAIIPGTTTTKIEYPYGGVALNPEAKEVIVLENNMPAALRVYHLPEVFAR